MGNKMSAQKSIEHVSKLNSLEDLGKFLVSEKALEKPRKTVLDAIVEREKFISDRNEENGNEIVETKSEEIATKEEQVSLDISFVPETVATEIFKKIAKSNQFIEKAKKAVNLEKYIIKSIDDKEGLDNATQLKNAIRDVRKQTDTLRKDETAPFREVTSLVNDKFNANIVEAKKLEQILDDRIKAIKEEKERIKAEKEEAARKKLVEKELAEIKAKEEELTRREKLLEDKQAELEKLYPGIMKKAMDKKADRKLEQPIDNGLKPQEVAPQLTEEEQVLAYLESFKSLVDNSPKMSEERTSHIMESINKNILNVVNVFKGKIAKG